MHLALFILSAGVIVSSFAPNKHKFGQKVNSAIGETSNENERPQLTSSNENPIKVSNQEKIPARVLIDEDGDDAVEDVDFDEDEFDDENFKGLLGAGSVTSLMHIHQKEGEILVPCFGMWWPMGGYNTGGVYDYIDYYGDYRKKKRRSRKQKKAAKMKKKRN